MRSGDVGLAILASIGLMGESQWGVRQSAELENQMIAVERIIEFIDLPSEASLETEASKKPSQPWPSNGQMSFKQLNLRYADRSERVLKNISMDVSAAV